MQLRVQASPLWWLPCPHRWLTPEQPPRQGLRGLLWPFLRVTGARPSRALAARNLWSVQREAVWRHSRHVGGGNLTQLRTMGRRDDNGKTRPHGGPERQPSTSSAPGGKCRDLFTFGMLHAPVDKTTVTRTRTRRLRRWWFAEPAVALVLSFCKTLPPSHLARCSRRRGPLSFLCLADDSIQSCSL